MKSKTLIRWWALLLCLLTIVPVTAIAQQEPTYSGGSGTKEDPWIIATAEDLNAMAVRSDRSGKMYASFSNKYFKQTADIDMKDYPEFKGICYLDKKSVCRKQTGFYGHYDGDGHVISNMTINLPKNSCVGLFSEVTQAGSVHDVHLDSSCKIVGKFQVGGIVGMIFGGTNDATASVWNCTSGASVHGTFMCGGIVGDIRCNIPTTQTVNLSVWHCLNYGSITKTGSQEDAAGIVGNVSSGGQMIECMNLGSVYAPQAPEVGGITGYAGTYSDGTMVSGVINCVNYGYVYGGNGTGGVVGLVQAGGKSKIGRGAYLLHSLNVGAVKSTNQYVGNIVGKTYGANIADIGNLNSATL